MNHLVLLRSLNFFMQDFNSFLQWENEPSFLSIIKEFFMENLKKLLQIVHTLLAPGGCPWDRAQTLASMRSSLLEESCELIEAIDLEEKDKIQEELGDIIFMAIFLGLLAEKEQICTLHEAVETINKKLIRRHPHVFSNGEALPSATAVKDQWDRIKQTEKQQKSLLDRIPKGLPALARANEILQAMKKKKYPFFVESKESVSEMEIGMALLAISKKAHSSDIEPEQALRKVLSLEEKKFREWEENLGIGNNLC
ncbi:Nucleoside triphosphate pyrophosphohydrolase [Chlamydiales bacterium STE3]|nr:Nucleoside triphosphate pyrophosphohydrolase [Chlamydiales bacterium STE3]